MQSRVAIVVICIVLIASLCIFVVLFLLSADEKKQEISKNLDPPPGYEIVCDLEQGYYAPKMPNGGYIIAENYGGKPMKTRQEAIDRAWAQYRFKPKPTELYHWQDCK